MKEDTHLEIVDVEQTVQQTRENLNTLTGNLALNTLISGLITFLVCVIAIFIVKAVLTKTLNRMTRLDLPVRNLIIKLVTTFMWALTIIIVAGAFGINATSLVAVLSVAGLALSLSVQNLLTNFFSGILLLINKPFKEGDFVEIGDKMGTIKNIGFFSAILVTPDNVSIVIPNGDLTAAAVKNYSREPNRRVDLMFSASYDASTETVKARYLSINNHTYLYIVNTSDKPAQAEIQQANITADLVTGRPYYGDTINLPPYTLRSFKLGAPIKPTITIRQ